MFLNKWELLTVIKEVQFTQSLFFTEILLQHSFRL